MKDGKKIDCTPQGPGPLWAGSVTPGGSARSEVWVRAADGTRVDLTGLRLADLESIRDACNEAIRTHRRRRQLGRMAV